MKTQTPQTETLTTTEQIKGDKIILLLAFAGIYIIWGSTYLAMRVVLHSIPMCIMVGSRFLMAGSIMFLWAYLAKHKFPKKIELKRAAITGLLLLVSGNAGVALANRYINSSGVIAVLVAITPFWVVILQWIILKKKPLISVWIGIVLGMIGMMVLSGPENLIQLGERAWIGVGFIILSTIGWALGVIYMTTGRMPSSSLYSAGIQMLSAGFLMSITSLFTGEWQELNVNLIDQKSLISLAYLVICGSVLGFTSFAYVARHASASSATTYAYINPIIALFLGWWLGDETINQQTIIASSLLMVAVALVVTKPKLS